MEEHMYTDKRTGLVDNDWTQRVGQLRQIVADCYDPKQSLPSTWVEDHIENSEQEFDRDDRDVLLIFAKAELAAIRPVGHRYYEDNGGGIHMFITYAGEVDRGATGLEHGYEGEGKDTREDLLYDPHEELDQWDSSCWVNDQAAVELYNYLVSTPDNAKLIADETAIYPERMGVAGRRYFGIKDD